MRCFDAAPGRFKSAFALDIACRIAERETVAYFGLEESARFRLKRPLARAAGLSLSDAAFAGTRAPGRIHAASEQLAEQLRYLHMCCGERTSTADIRRDLARIDRVEAQPITVVVDALQNLAPPAGEEQENRRREVDLLMEELTRIRDEFCARVLVLSHAARAAGVGQYKTGLSAAKESSGIEYTGDFLAVLTREDVPVVSTLYDGAKPLVRLVANVEKRRTGPLGETVFAVDPTRGLFSAWGRSHEQRYRAAKAEEQQR